MLVSGCFGFRPCRMNGTPRMMRGRVKRVQLQRDVARIDNVMPRSGRHKDTAVAANELPAAQMIFIVAHEHQALASGNTEKLVRVRMRLKSDFFADGNAHQRHLQMAASPQSCTEGVVLQGGLVDVHIKGVRSIVHHVDGTSVSIGVTGIIGGIWRINMVFMAIGFRGVARRFKTGIITRGFVARRLAARGLVTRRFIIKLFHRGLFL